MNRAQQREQEIKAKARALLDARAHVTLGKPLPKATPVGPQLVKEEAQPDVKAWEEACDQVRRAKELLALPPEAYLEYPFPSLAALVGGVRPGRVHYYVSASNNGKTTFVRSFIEAAISQGQKCAVMTTETTPADFRMSIAAASLGLDFGDIATGAYHKWPNAAQVRGDLARELERWQDYESGASSALRVSEASGYLTPEKVRQSAREAANTGADWWIIDHGDHIEGTHGQSETQVSNAVNTSIWRAALDLDLRAIVLSQMNQDVFRQAGMIGLCMTPLESWVKYGGKKKEVGWVMLGASRRLRPFVDEQERKAEIAAYKDGQRAITDITIPVAHVRVMKHRDYGARVGQSCLLEVRRGRYVEPTKDTAGIVHGIRTNRGDL